jgi:hypothetical protein
MKSNVVRSQNVVPASGHISVAHQNTPNRNLSVWISGTPVNPQVHQIVTAKLAQPIQDRVVWLDFNDCDCTAGMFKHNIRMLA